MTPPGHRRPRFVPPDREDFAALEAEVHRGWLRERLAAALDRLPPDARRAFVLHVVDGWEVEVVAADLGRTPGEVRALCGHARRTLRGDLERGEHRGEGNVPGDRGPGGIR